MCDENGLCGRGHDLEAMREKIVDIIALCLDGQQQRAAEQMHAAIKGEARDGLMACFALAQTAARYFPIATGAEPGAPGYILEPVPHPLTGQMADIDAASPGPVFAIRFAIAYCNGDYDMCAALYNALLHHEDCTAFAMGIHSMMTMSANFARELIAMEGS